MQLSKEQVFEYVENTFGKKPREVRLLHKTFSVHKDRASVFTAAENSFLIGNLQFIDLGNQTQLAAEIDIYDNSELITLNAKWGTAEIANPHKSFPCVAFNNISHDPLVMGDAVNGVLFLFVFTGYEVLM